MLADFDRQRYFRASIFNREADWFEKAYVGWKQNHAPERRTSKLQGKGAPSSDYYMFDMTIEYSDIDILALTGVRVGKARCE